VNTHASFKTGGADLALATHSVLAWTTDSADGLAALSSMCLVDISELRSETAMGPFSQEQAVIESPPAHPAFLLRQSGVVAHGNNR
jgi:hypothetical protein